MRVIEEKMIKAIETLDHAGGPSSLTWAEGNTAVVYRPTIGDNEIEIFLHGNLIAVRHIGNKWSVSLCGWDTATTRSRLSAIIRSFAACGPEGLGVSSNKRKGVQVIKLHDAKGARVIAADGFFPVSLKA